MSNIFIFILIRMVFVQCKLDEIKKLKYDTTENVRSYSEIKNIDIIFEQVKIEYDEEIDRGKYVVEKAKTLITVITLFIAIIGGSQFLKESPFLIFGLIAFLPSIILILKLFGIKSVYNVKVDDKQVTISDDKELKKSLINDYFKVIHENSYKNDLLVDIYRSAQRWLVVGLIVLLIVTSLILYFANSTNNPPKDMLQLRLSEYEKSKDSLVHRINVLDFEVQNLKNDLIAKKKCEESCFAENKNKTQIISGGVKCQKQLKD